MTEHFITSAFQFLQMADEFKKNRNHQSEIEFYRGHSNSSWRLLPSVYRKCLLGFEEDLIAEFMRRKPDEFSVTEGIFNVVAKMQHFGLFTRLLDVTENPAVALYFSCNDNFETDGEIFLFQVSLDDIPNNAVSNIIMDFYIQKRDRFNCGNIESYYKKISGINKEKDVDMAFYFIMNGFWCHSRPKIISERILRQLGSFILFTNEVCPHELCENEKCIKRNSDMCHKDSVPERLEDRLRISTVKSRISDRTDAHIESTQNGYRYIVKAEYKKKILSQLSTIGINRSFLFPELSNVGIDVIEEYQSRIT